MKIPNFKEFESVIKREKDQEIFNYKQMINTAWNSVIHEAQDFYQIYFDLENDETTGSKKTIYIQKNLRKGQPIKYEFNCEAFEGSGDWECPVLYFRVEFTHDYGIRSNKQKVEHIFDVERDISKDKYISEMYNKYVLIPDNNNGNFLIQTDKGFRAYQDEDLKRADLKWKDVEPDEKKAWKWLEDLLNKLVKERHQMLDEPDSYKISDAPSPELPVPVLPLTLPIGGGPELVVGVDPVEPILPSQPTQLLAQ